MPVSALTSITQRPMRELAFRTHDGVDLFYRHWPAPQGPTPACGAIVLFHRGHEHSARMAHLVDELDLPEFDFFAWDARGHGRSPGVRGFSPGIGTSVRDVHTFIDHVSSTHDFAVEDIGVIAQSVGAVLVATWAHDYAPGIRCMVLASPAFKVKLYVPFARPGLRLMHKLRGNFFVNSYVKAKFLTHDPARIASFNADPLITRPISANVLLGLYDVADRIVADAQAIVVPTQLLVSGADWVVHHGPQHAFFDRLGAVVKERHVFPGFYHDTLGERDRAKAVARARSFLLRMFAKPLARPDLRDADQGGFTREESDALAAPLHAWSPRALYWAATRASMRMACPVSEGMRIGHATGFDSGSTLDYVYLNQPTGFTPLGRLIDRNYLASIGWRGIRQRKVHIEELLRHAIADRRAAGVAVHIVDIAAGHGRYVLEALTAAGAAPDSILLRDYSELNVEKGVGADPRKEPVRDGDVRARRCVRPCEPRRAGPAPDDRHRVRALRALCRQRAVACVARGARRCHRPRRSADLYRSAVASATRAHRARVDEPPRRPGVGDAPADAGRNGPTGGGRGIPQARAAHRRMGDLHRLARAPRCLMTAVSVEPHPWRRALAWLSFLAPFFFLTYGLANWAAAQRADVPALVFEWERALPFWAWTIVPYWSIDVLYGVSLFVCTSRRELDTHGKRLLTAQLVAVAFFVAIPHRFSFERPSADGIFGAMFDALMGFDRPFNQIPSLHIALAVILWALYARHVRGLARILLDVWFMLIGASVLTTYQHHFIDIPTGLALGWLCVWLWPFADNGVQEPAVAWRRTTDPARHRVAVFYALGALACVTIATVVGGWALWLGWPALALAVVAACYSGLGAAGFQKSNDGRLSVGTRWLLAPYLAGAWLNSRWWTRGHPKPVAVRDDVWIGRMPSSRDLRDSRFTGVVDLAAELASARGSHDLAVVPVLDLTTPAPQALADAAAAIERLRARGPVLVCCALGYSRSACAVAAWLLATGRAATVDAALAMLRAARAQVVLGAPHVAALRAIRLPDQP